MVGTAQQYVVLHGYVGGGHRTSFLVSIDRRLGFEQAEWSTRFSDAARFSLDEAVAALARIHAAGIAAAINAAEAYAE